MRVLLITGPAGAAQGWGDLGTTEKIRDTIAAAGSDAQILYVESMDDLMRGIASTRFDMVWSALYHISQHSDHVGVAASRECWVADILDQKQIPYVGSDSLTMKRMIDKAATHRVLAAAGVPIPMHILVKEHDPLPEVSYPAFVKPSCESESTGISEESVVHSPEELEIRIRYVADTFRQPVLVEEYLPGSELTVAMIGNGNGRIFMPVENAIHPSSYRKYPLIMGNMKQEGLVRLQIPNRGLEDAKWLASAAADAMGCLDHVRIDMREDDSGNLRVIEVNGIPGLNPKNSRSLRIHGIYNPTLIGEDNFRVLIGAITSSAAERYGISLRRNDSLLPTQRHVVPPTASLQITMKIDSRYRTEAVEVYSMFKRSFLETIPGAKSKEFLVRDEDVQVHHGFVTAADAENYLSSTFFNHGVVNSLKPYLMAQPDIRIYTSF
jgi:D-alanine-D-alanine ligase